MLYLLFKSVADFSISYLGVVHWKRVFMSMVCYGPACNAARMEQYCFYEGNAIRHNLDKSWLATKKRSTPPSRFKHAETDLKWLCVSLISGEFCRSFIKTNFCFCPFSEEQIRQRRDKERNTKERDRSIARELVYPRTSLSFSFPPHIFYYHVSSLPPLMW